MDKALEKLKALTLAEQLITGGGVLMLIASFFDWWHYSIDIPKEARDIVGAFGGATSIGRDGWGDPGSLWSILAILIAIALAGLIIASKVGDVALPALPTNWTWGMVFGGGAAAVVVLMLLKAWRIMAAPAGGFGIGFFIAVVGAALIGYGGYLIYSSEKSGVVRS